MQAEKYGILYLCATPIGNLEDISIRAVNILKQVNFVAAEDTRRTIKLLNYFNIKNKLTSYHEHNKIKKGRELIQLLKEGNNIALVSDAGMPGISDPGQDLVQMAVVEGIQVSVVPGATAALAGLVVSGISTERFVFEGFLPKDKKGRRQRLAVLAHEKRTIIIYEAPHRLIDTLNDIKNLIGERNTAVCRELTKIYEEVIRGRVSQVMDHYSNVKPLGEIVIIIEGSMEQAEMASDGFKGMEISIEEHIKLYLGRGLDKKQAVKRVAQERNLPKNEVYRHSIDI